MKSTNVFFSEILHNNLLFLSIHPTINGNRDPTFNSKSKKAYNLNMKESRYIALFVVSGSIKKLFLINHVNIYLFSMLFAIILPVEKCGVTPHSLYRDSLILSVTEIQYKF